jgi:PhnB protein
MDRPALRVPDGREGAVAELARLTGIGPGRILRAEPSREELMDININPYLNFPGTCAEAFAAYADILGGEVTFSQSYGDSPMGDEMPGEYNDYVMHATLSVGGKLIMASDATPDRYVKPGGTYVSVQMPDVETARTAFDRLSEGGDVQMPFQKTFWAEGFGMLVDRYGTPWMFNVSHD